jgi:phenylacetic acid degradation operon negative regulatory protein
MSTERKLTARSVIASALLGARPPRLPVARLVQLAEAFGINENRCRVALSRMAANGEVRADQGLYSLLARQERQRTGLHGLGAASPWRDRWHVVVLPGAATPAAERTERRRLLSAARLAEWREGVWVRPDNVPLAPDGLPAEALVLTAAPADARALRAAVGDLWDIAGIAVAAERSRRRLAATEPDDRRGIAEGFVLAADVICLLQSDPLLPADVLPGEWPMPLLRTEFRPWYRTYQRTVATL